MITSVKVQSVTLLMYDNKLVPISFTTWFQSLSLLRTTSGTRSNIMEKKKFVTW